MIQKGNHDINLKYLKNQKQQKKKTYHIQQILNNINSIISHRKSREAIRQWNDISEV